MSPSGEHLSQHLLPFCRASRMGLCAEGSAPTIPPAFGAGEVLVSGVGDVAAGVFVGAGGGAEGGLPGPFPDELLLGSHGVFGGAGSVCGVDVAQERGEVGGGVFDLVGDGPVPGPQHFVGGGLDVYGVQPARAKRWRAVSRRGETARSQ